MTAKINPEYLKMEYEQTVQTLRNWDTLFFNTFSSVVIAGGIGGIIAWQGVQGVQDVLRLKALLVAVPSVLYFIALLYFIYNLVVAQRKFEVLNEIEKHLGLIGSYRENRTIIKKILYFVFFPLFTIVFLGYLFYVVTYM